MNIRQAKQFCDDLKRGAQERLMSDTRVHIESELNHDTWEQVGYIYSQAGDAYAQREEESVKQ